MTRSTQRKRPGASPFVAAAIAAATLLAGCAPLIVGGAVVGGAMVATDRRTSGSQVDDEVIELKAKGRMGEAFPDGDNARINTTSYNRMVLLTGEVPTEADKTTAEQVVARIDNVQSVVNELTVGPPNTFGERTKAAFITAKVKASLVDAKDLFANSIKVVTHRGVVYLMGRVTEREATRASEVARGVSGVTKVVRVFEILSESELANTAPKALARPASAP
jgi:osmotically-inducible protein OsmY